MKIGLVAGETSSDLLAAGLCNTLKANNSQVQCAGVVGPALQKAGCQSFASIDRLSVLGWVEPLFKIRSIMALQRQLVRDFSQWPADWVVGVDSGDFNIPLLEKLRAQGIRTAQFVSPQIWAWRKSRIHRIKRAVSHVFCLFPFEKTLYDHYEVSAQWVGHPMADAIPLTYQPPPQGLPPTLAILPGSRRGTFMRLAPLFLEAAAVLAKELPQLHLQVALVRSDYLPLWQRLQNAIAPQLSASVLVGNMREQVLASHAVLLPSGTATLETLFLKRPMVIANRVSSVSYWLAKHLIKLPHIGLPNILAQRTIVPELIQNAATPANIAQNLRPLFEQTVHTESMQAEFSRIHQSLQRNAYARIAAALL